MEEPKATDKRKAPDKNSSGELSDEDASKQTQVKRPRLDMPVSTEMDTIDALGLPREGDVLSETLLETSNIIGDTAESILKETPDAFLNAPEGIPTQILASDADQNLNFKMLTENGGGDNERVEANRGSQPSGLEVQLHADQRQEVGITVEQEGTEMGGSEHNNNEDKQFQAPSSPPGKARGKHEPKVTSSPVTSEHDAESADQFAQDMTKVIEIRIKALDPVTGATVVDDITVNSTMDRLSTFLSVHGITLLANISQSSGYSADISSQDTSQPKTRPLYTSSRSKRSRYTSSTLGSSIPRESMATILSTSPHRSPNDEAKQDAGQKKFGRARGPKLTSTHLSKTSPSGETSSDKLAKVNGDDSSPNGITPKKLKKGSSSNKSSEKSSKLKMHDIASSLNSTSSKGSTPIKNKSAKKGTPKSRTLSQSREFAGISSAGSSPITVPGSTSVEPSPARTLAKVEGTEAKPMTKFELEVNNEPVDVKELKKSLTVWSRISPNELCYARWRDKKYYSGVILEKWTNDTYKIDFDDGMDGVASETHIVPIKILGVGTVGVYTPDNMFKPFKATVLGQKFVEDPEVGTAVKYAVTLDGEETPIWCTRRQLSIEEADAKNLRAEFAPTSKAPKAAELSLGNIVTGPRRRGTTSTPGPAESKIVGGAFDESVSASPATTSKSKMTPKSRATPGKKGKKKPVDSSDGNSSNTEVVSKDSFSSMVSTPGSSKSISIQDKKEVTPKDSPKKIKSKDALLFEGYSFFLTASGGGDQASTGGGSPIPYDKDEYRDLIENHGGTIVDNVGKEGKAKDRVFLISDNYARTVKYIYCLAASTPCVSHAWIQKCLEENAIIPWKKYELNSGWSLELNKVIPAHTQKPLSKMKIFITAGSDDLYNYWKPVLTAAQATLLKTSKKDKDKNEIPPGTDVIVTDATCAQEILDRASAINLPLVKPEWLVQSIIAGKRVDYFGHEKYRVDEPLDNDGDDDEEDEEDEDNDEDEDEEDQS